MPDRAIPPLMVAVTLSFIAGIVAASLRLEESPQFWLGVAGTVASAAAALPTLTRRRADPGERIFVTLLRAGLAGAVFVFIYVGMLAFLLDSSLLAIVWALIAALNGLALSRLRLREHPPAQRQGDATG